ncbi:hypothetical protein TWF481_002638 [Arthrobotrys musiformis]|uniref:CHAT domain-containing protein n=1 Tax=Arthrobotrys musiformis TaxID=47236 RepID=A0AAV9VQS1_9PEZI
MEMAVERENIYERAQHCKELFAKYAPKRPPSDTDRIFQDYEQRFLAWSAYMGVFADKSICLDRRLRDRPDVSDIVIMLLDVLIKSLGQIVDQDEAPPDDPSLMDGGRDENQFDGETNHDSLRDNKEAFNIIETSLSQLSRLGVTIRASLTTSLEARIRRFAEKSSPGAFESRARRAINFLYPDSKGDLRVQLTRSMVETYERILYKKSHQRKLNTPRDTKQQAHELKIVKESPNLGFTGSQNMTSSEFESPSVPRHKLLVNFNQSQHDAEQESTPSTLPSVRQRLLQKTFDASSKDGSQAASSVQLGKVTYPRPPKGEPTSYRTCDWCLQRYHGSFLENEVWWRNHMDKDFTPYVCISEKCMSRNKLPSYSTFKEWHLHMKTEHSLKWQQEIHRPISWVCNINHETKYFDTINALYEHAIGCHRDKFSEAELKAIVPNSHIEFPRSHRVCPLCCRDLIPEKRRKKPEVETRKRRKRTDWHEMQATKASFALQTNDNLDRENLDSDEQTTEAPEIGMARHIAAHLQGIMFLTIRLMECDDSGEDAIDTRTSHIASTRDFSILSSRESLPSPMSEDASPFESADYTIGWICALPLEFAAAVAMLDERHPSLPQDDLDDNAYEFGRVGSYNVIIACLPCGVYGVTSAAHVASQMRRSFPSIIVGLMVGIAGGAPTPPQRDIRLGDVVVSEPAGGFGGVLPYDVGKTVQEGRFVQTGVSNELPKVFLLAIAKLKSEYLLQQCRGIDDIIARSLSNETVPQEFARPPNDSDRLFQARYDHSSENASCDRCESRMVVKRPPRPHDQPYIHYGLIASGNQVMKHGITRDCIAREKGVLCFEMEAAGLTNVLPSLVVRGICDYSDSHENEVWQPYAALSAAAFAKELLFRLPLRDNDKGIAGMEPFNINAEMTSLLDNLSGEEDLYNFAAVQQEQQEQGPVNDEQIELYIYTCFLVFRKTGSRKHLEQAIQQTEGWIAELALGHADRARRLQIFDFLSAWMSQPSFISERENELPLLGTSQKIKQELIPEVSTQMINRNEQRAIKLAENYEQTGILETLNEAISIMLRNVDLAGEYITPRILKNLAVMLGTRFNRTGSMDDLDRAVEVANMAVDATSQDHPDRAGRLNNLGYYLERQFERTESMDDLNRALSSYKEGWNCDTAPPSVRIRLAWNAARILASQNDWDVSSSLLDDAIRLLPLVSPRSLNHTDKQSMLPEFAGLASMAAAISLNAGRDVYRALQSLELGRGVIASLLMDMRGDISSLRHQHPDLAEEFVSLRNALDSPVDRLISPLLTDNMPSWKSQAQSRYELDRRFTELIATIRAKHGFDRFLLPPMETEIKDAACSGPVVVINPSSYRCDAFLVERDQIRVLELPHLSPKEVRSKTQSLGPRQKASFPIKETLEWLWDTVCHPILDALGFDRPISPDDNWPRIWWVPTGLLSQFPLHAAGYHKHGSTETVLDRTMSSYASSIKALIHGRRQHVRTSAGPDPDADHALLVAMKHTPDLVANQFLPFVEDEVEMLKELCPLLRLKSIRPTLLKDDVLKHMQGCKVFHFAGHGSSHPTEPSQSYLLLNDWKTDPLTVGDVRDCRFQEKPPFLGYLSACLTGANEAEKLADEGIHLVSSFQLAGFRHVIGALWEVSDRHCVNVARVFYETMRDDGMTDEAVCRGLHRALRALRGEEMEESEARNGTLVAGDPTDFLWAPYIHFGV